MSGHFSAFKNREKISKAKKVIRKETIGAKKSDLIKYGSFINEGNNDLPTPSEEELKKIKAEIKEKIQTSNRKKETLFAISFFIIITVLIVLSIKFNLF